MLHVGLPKTGTTYLQALLAANRDRLRAAGVLYPFIRPGAMFHGAVEIRGSHAKFGLSADEVAGTWAALCERAREHDGTTIISHEVLAGATREQIRTALEPLAGIDVQVVVTARDLGRQAVAHWQEEVKLGATYSFAEFEATELRADTGPGAGPTTAATDRTSGTPRTSPTACGAGRRDGRGRATWSSLPRPGASPGGAVAPVRRGGGRRPGASSTPPPASRPTRRSASPRSRCSAR